MNRISPAHPRLAGAALRWRAAACGRWLATLLVACAMLWAMAPAARAEKVQLASLELAREDDGLQLSFSSRFELPRVVEDALTKGVPLYFIADADVYRSRWYWRDERVAHATRTWRLAWQPLTRAYRVSFGGLNQSFDTLPEAMAAVRGTAHWKIADLAQVGAGSGYYVEFSYRLDTSQLPRPMQIGLTGQADWDLSVERSLRLD